MPAQSSWRSSLRSLSPAARAEAVASLTEAEATALLHDWPAWARADQLPPEGDWLTWLCLCGRGWGKTRVGAEFVRARVESGEAKRIALVGRTAADTRDTMVLGESGLLEVFPPHQRPIYEPSKRRVTFHNGAFATLYSADEPNLLRGPQHDTAWADELAAWKYADAWDQLLLGLRLGRPRVVVTTTPRPTQIIRDVMKRPSTKTVRGSTYDNADNLAATFLAEVKAKYEGTRLGRQELYAELLEDTQGALWTRAQLEVLTARAAPELKRVVVAVDPSVAGDGGGDECGLIALGVDGEGTVWVLEDGSEHLSPEAWSRRACELAERHGADCIVAESNNGGALVELTIRGAWSDRSRVPPKIRLVHAARGKRPRAEPVAALYEQKRVRHLAGLSKLEDEMTTCAFLAGDDSPNRMDALVWGVTDLALDAPKPKRSVTYDYPDV